MQVEATVGNIITDAMVEAYKDKRDMTGRRFWMALHNSGGIRWNAGRRHLVKSLSGPTSQMVPSRLETS
jgi:hypothetical protein